MSHFLVLQAFVAGWGSHVELNCITDWYGPSAHKPCKFPFTYHESPFYGCTHSDSPASLNPLCKKFNKGVCYGFFVLRIGCAIFPGIYFRLESVSKSGQDI